MRKELLNLPAEQWYADYCVDLSKVCLTNLRREADRATSCLRSLLAPLHSVWEEWNSSNGIWTVHQTELAGLMVFHCALWRSFGTVGFMQAFGFHYFADWNPATKACVIQVCLECRARGEPCFTQAYGPARYRANAERPADVSKATLLYSNACDELDAIWAARHHIVSVAQSTHSWPEVLKVARAVKHFGGSGFRAKELLLDLLPTPVFFCWNDGKWKTCCAHLDEYCPVGPGARRGLNRLHGRPVREAVACNDQATQDRFAAELLWVYEEREKYWNPEEIVENAACLGPLALHDLQFQFCEYDKAERFRLAEGFVRARAEACIRIIALVLYSPHCVLISNDFQAVVALYHSHILYTIAIVRIHFFSFACRARCHTLTSAHSPAMPTPSQRS